MSDLLVFQMYIADREMGVSAHEVLSSIKNVESGEPHSGIKPATMFTRPPLRGLWHKHYFSAQFLMTNISLALGKNGLENLIDEVFDTSKPVVTQEMINELAYRFAHEPVEKRDADGKITGEWLIYAKHGGKNYWLSMHTHDAGDQVVFDEIMTHCVKNFPDLQAWIEAEANKA